MSNSVYSQYGINYERTITFKEMLQEMESSLATFSLVWTTLDLTRKKGGEVKKHHGLVLKRNLPNRKKKKKADVENGNMKLNQHFNLYDPDEKCYVKLYKRSINGFNGKRVIY